MLTLLVDTLALGQSLGTLGLDLARLVPPWGWPYLIAGALFSGLDRAFPPGYPRARAGLAAGSGAGENRAVGRRRIKGRKRRVGR